MAIHNGVACPNGVLGKTFHGTVDWLSTLEVFCGGQLEFKVSLQSEADSPEDVVKALSTADDRKPALDLKS